MWKDILCTCVTDTFISLLVGCFLVLAVGPLMADRGAMINTEFMNGMND